MILKNSQKSVLGFALVACLIFATSGNAGLINGSFEQGLTNWTGIGPNSSVPNGDVNGFDATDGNFYASLNTGQGAQSVTVLDVVISSVGLPSNYISSNFLNASEGGILLQTFFLDPSRDTLSFDWNFLTNRTTPSPGNNDFAFALLFNQTTGSSVATSYVDTFSTGFSNGGPDFTRETGWANISFGGLTGGHEYSIVFGVVNRGNTSATSGLLIDNVRAIPEPGSIISVALVGLALASRRNRFRRN